MLVKKPKRGYTVKRKYIQGKGFVDSLSNAFNSIKPYLTQNKDLIAKPLLAAVGDLAAFGLTQGGKALLTKIMNSKNSKVDPKAVDIVSNIIGSGITNF